MFDLIIKNAQVIDGSGNKPYKADLGIKKDMIDAIGSLKDADTRQLIDAQGKIVCPGFIDVHSHADLTYFRNDQAELLSPLVMQGITTFFGGNCGMALAPVTKNHTDELQTYLEVFTQMDFEKDIQWDSMGSFMVYTEKKGLLLNTAMLAPHGVLRISASGMNDRPCTNAEINSMKSLLDESMEAGAFGLSTGLQYAPGSQSDTDELIKLTESLSRYDNPVFTCHLRSYTSTTLNKAIDEVASIAGANNIHGHISHIFSVPWTGPAHNQVLKVLKWLARNGEKSAKYIPDFLIDMEMNKILKQLKKIRHNGTEITMDVMPTTAGFTHLLAFFPPWALVGTKNDILNRVKDRTIRKEMLNDINKGVPKWPHRGKNDWSLNIMRQLGWDAVTIMAVHSEKNKHLEGRLFTDIGAEQRKHPFDVMCDLLIEEDGRVLAFESLSEPDDAFTEKYTFPALKDPKTMITTDSILLGMGQPSYLFYGCYPKFIERYVNKFNLIDLPTAISKCTGLPATEFGIKHRGFIKENHFADLLMIDPDNFKTKAVFRNPAQSPTGIDLVMINGKIVAENGKRNRDILAGRMLRKNNQSPN